MHRHQERVDRSRHHYYGKGPSLKLAEVLETLDLPSSGTFKLRLLYGARVEKWEVLPYSVREVTSLRVVAADDLRYGRKYADRSGIDKLFNQRQDSDDILMVQREHLTDSSYANLALYDGSKWYTPAWPLLRGTRRAQLIDEGILQPTIIRLRDLFHFEQVRLINAMMDWTEGPTIPISRIAGV
ncbi:aminotransferase class IV [Neolewinella litorea]|uniref:aminotransferase class IV n=1 Tax=Neolewinella litorea TaxID=2562452 RepID=UPI001B3B99CA|nr:aminotransferase class IV [Neolewinella litorea]